MKITLHQTIGKTELEEAIKRKEILQRRIRRKRNVQRQTSVTDTKITLFFTAAHKVGEGQSLPETTEPARGKLSPCFCVTHSTDLLSVR